MVVTTRYGNRGNTASSVTPPTNSRRSTQTPRTPARRPRARSVSSRKTRTRVDPVAAAQVEPPSEEEVEDGLEEEDDSVNKGDLEEEQDEEEEGFGTNLQGQFLSTITDPYSRPIDLKTKSGLYVFKEYASVPKDHKPIDLVLANGKKMFDAFEDKGMSFAFENTIIPTAGTGALRPNAPPGASALSQLVDLSSFKNMLQRKYLHDVTLTHVKTWISWAFGGEDQLLEPRDITLGNEMEFVDVDPNKDGPVGKVNQIKVQIRIKDNALMRFVKDLVTPSGWKALLTRKHEFAFWSNSESRFILSGTILTKTVLAIVNPSVMLSTRDFETEFKTVTLMGMGGDVFKLITRLQHCQQLIIEEKGLVFATSDMLMENVFRAFNIEKLTNESFRLVVAQHYQKWLCAKKGTFDAEESISDMLSVYRNLVALKKWDPSSAPVAKKPGYVSLATKDQKSIDGLHEKLDLALATNASNKKKDSAWKFVKGAKIITEPGTGIKFEWCNKHGQYGGMYMPHPHNHDEWQREKDAKNARYEAKKAATVKAASAGTIPNKIGLNKETRAALSSRLQAHAYSNTEIDQLLDFDKVKEESKE